MMAHSAIARAREQGRDDDLEMVALRSDSAKAAGGAVAVIVNVFGARAAFHAIGRRALRTFETGTALLAEAVVSGRFHTAEGASAGQNRLLGRTRLARSTNRIFSRPSWRRAMPR